MWKRSLIKRGVIGAMITVIILICSLLTYNSMVFYRTIGKMVEPGGFMACAIAEREWEIQFSGLAADQKQRMIDGRGFSAALIVVKNYAVKMDGYLDSDLDSFTLVALADWAILRGDYDGAERKLSIAQSKIKSSGDFLIADILARREAIRERRLKPR